MSTPAVPTTVNTSVLRWCLVEEIRDGLLKGLVSDELADVAADRVGELVDRLAVSADAVQRMVVGLSPDDIDALATYAQYLNSDGTR